MTPRSFAVPPALKDHHDRSDALSALLQAIDLRGDRISRVSTSTQNRHAEPGGCRLHLVEQGPVRMTVRGLDSVVELDTGDLILLPHGAADTMSVVEAARGASWLTGSFTFDDSVARPLFAVLPPAITVRSDTASRQWLDTSLSQLLIELTTPSPGSWAMMSRILDLLFIHALRDWSSRTESTRSGWLTAAMDPVLAPALMAMHNDPGQDWPVQRLAGLASMSRSAFSLRFGALMGTPPAAYLAALRLEQAAQALRASDHPISTVADRVGYRSTAAFSRAFARRFGVPPHRWRLQGRAAAS